MGGMRRFRALYLPDSERTRTRLAGHRPATAESCRRLVERYGMVVFCGNSAPHGLETDLLSMPLSVDMEAVVPRTTEVVDARWTRSAKANIAKIRKTGFVSDVVAGGTWVSAFSRRMFRPSIHRRYGARAYLDTPGALARYARAEGAELLRVLLDGQWVAGILAQSVPEGYRFLRLGWLDGDDELFKRGVVSAMYWFGFQRAAALGHQRLLFGSVEPHLEDGLLRYKSNWGGRLSTDSRDFGSFRLLLEPAHPACSRFLRYALHHPQRHRRIVRCREWTTARGRGHSAAIARRHLAVVSVARPSGLAAGGGVGRSAASSAAVGQTTDRSGSRALTMSHARSAWSSPAAIALACGAERMLSWLQATTIRSTPPRA